MNMNMMVVTITVHSGDDESFACLMLLQQYWPACSACSPKRKKYAELKHQQIICSRALLKMQMEVVCPLKTISKFVCKFVCLYSVQSPSMHSSPCSSLHSSYKFKFALCYWMSCVYIKSISLYVHMSVCLLDPSDQNWSSNWAHQTQGCLANS